ncbi:MAG: tetratricopeptide repeat protein, partial [Flavobacteriales bacterium]
MHLFRASTLVHGIGRLLPGAAFACLIGLPLGAQDASLVPANRQELRAAPHDTARADALARLCFNLINTDPDSARRYGEQALALATRIGHPKAIADAHNNLGWLETQQGRVKAAEAHLLQALDGFRRMGNPSYTSIALSNLG